MRETALKKPFSGAHGVAKVRTVEISVGGLSRTVQGDGSRTGTINAKPVSSRHPDEQCSHAGKRHRSSTHGRVNLSRPGIT